MLKRMIFIIVVMFVMWILNTFFLGHVYKLFSINITKTFYLISILMALGVFVSMIINSLIPNNILARSVHIIGAIWIGVIFIGFFISIIFDLSFYFINIPLKIKGIIWLSSIIILSLYATINQLGIPEIKDVEIKIKGLKNNINIGYLSDIHIDGTHNIEYLEKLLTELNSRDVDMIIINGDLIDGISFERHNFGVINKSKAPIYITFGNHETYVGKEYVESLLKNTNAHILENKVVETNGINLIGIEDLRGLEQSNTDEKLKNILSNLKWNKNIPSLLIIHEPIGMSVAEENGIELQVAGHTHMGQIWPFNYLVKMAYPNIYGMYEIGNLKLFVGSGAGVWGPPMRLGSRNEMYILKLTK